MFLEIGIPVASPFDVTERLLMDASPAGTYGAATYPNPAEEPAGNPTPIAWEAANRIERGRWDTCAGDAFASRYEVLRGAPNVHPDPSNRLREVAAPVKVGSRRGRLAAQPLVRVTTCP